ncbi:E3 SUMO-protein ligase ZBED1-like [Crassostrea virginica]
MAAEVELFKNEKAKSAIWGHFKLKKENQKIVNNVAVCNICNETIKYSGGTTNLASHMRRHHGNVKINDQPDKKGPAANASTSTPMSKGQVALTTDGWTSRSTDSFITITAIFLDSDWSLQNFVLQTRVLSENHTGENIADMLQQAVEEWGLPSNPRPPIVTDNASNMEKAGIMFQAEYHIKCYAHTLNLAAQKSLKVKQVSHILSRMRKIECLRPLKTVTTSLCIERMPTISVIMPIQHTLLHKMQTKDDDCNGIKQMKNTIVQDLQHRYDHQRDILSIASFIDPRFKSLPFLADDSLKDEVHSSVINKLMEIGPMKIKEEPKETTTPPLPSAPMLDQIQTTDDSISSNKEDIDANNNSPQRKKVKQEDLASLFSDVYVVSYTPATEESLYEKATENIEIYKSLPPVPFDNDPLQWWKLDDQKVPLLATLARKILCIPATSVASERVFSTAGDIVSSQRACLNPTHIDKLIFLKKNLQ